MYDTVADANGKISVTQSRK